MTALVSPVRVVRFSRQAARSFGRVPSSLLMENPWTRVAKADVRIGTQVAWAVIFGHRSGREDRVSFQTLDRK
jgi:hypothetical protein